MTTNTNLTLTTNPDELWNSLCESIWEMDTVIDIHDYGVSYLAVERWFKMKALKAPSDVLRDWTLQLMGMTRARKLHEGDYGKAPEGAFELLEEPSGYLKSETQLLRSMTPNQIEQAGHSAGYLMGSISISKAHPLSDMQLG